MESPFAYTRPEEKAEANTTTIPTEQQQEKHESGLDSVIEQQAKEEQEQKGENAAAAEQDSEVRAEDADKEALEADLGEKLRVINQNHHGLLSANIPDLIHTESFDMSLREIKALKKATASKSVWRRFFNGFHRRISVILPGFLKKGNKKAMIKARAQLKMLEEAAEEDAVNQMLLQ